MGGRARDENETPWAKQAGLRGDWLLLWENCQTSPFFPDSCLKGEKDVSPSERASKCYHFRGPDKDLL